MKQTIEIEVPNGKKAVWKDGKIVFENILSKLPKTWEEFCESYPIKKDEVFINDSSAIIFCTPGNRGKWINQNILPNGEAALSHLAFMKLHQLRDCYRQGWIPNWKDEESIKYEIEFIAGKFIIWNSRTTQRFLSFQSKEIAEEFLKNFKDLIKEARDLI